MTSIGLISDTHGMLDPKVLEYFKDCDEIWHAGDFGTVELANQLAAFKPLVGVYGNIDGKDVRIQYPLDRRFNREGVNVWMTHIGGYPGRYQQRVRESLKLNAPDLFICGHSHILKVVRDKKHNNMLVVNPGAAGVYGFHKVRTIVRFELESAKIKNFQVIELGNRGS